MGTVSVTSPTPNQPGGQTEPDRLRLLLRLLFLQPRSLFSPPAVVSFPR